VTRVVVGDVVDGLREQDVSLVALVWVDNSGIARTKAIPLSGLARAAERGVGASPCFDMYAFDDTAVPGAASPGVVGDLRLRPVLERTVPFAAEPGWAFAPACRYGLGGEVHPADARTATARATDGLEADGLAVRAGFEVEWVIGRTDATGDAFVPATDGPAYGFARLTERARYLADVVDALEAGGVVIEQLHPEYAPGQFEIALGAREPVRAADEVVLARETIRAVSRRHGVRASFAPVVVPGGVGNGGHVHLGLSGPDGNLFAGGPRPAGAAFLAGVLERLDGVLAIGAPSVSSWLRLVPQRWAGASGCWGVENREAALRLVPGAAGYEEDAANLEVKCVDQTANPYLLLAVLLTAGAAGMREGAVPPPPVDVDPATIDRALRPERGVAPLPVDLAAATDAFSRRPELTACLGEALSAMIVDLRRAEVARFEGCAAEDVVRAQRWTH
jgi:glutamine synthetase